MALTHFAAAELHISISADALFHIGEFPVTNGLVTGILGSTLFVAIFVYVAMMLRKNKYNRFVGLVQWVFEGLLKQVDAIIPNKKIARKITPLAVTIFFAVLFNYWLSVIPGLDSIKWNDVPVLRSSAADLNFTLALAIITVVTVQLYAIKHMGFLKNAHRYLRNPLKDPIGAFEGMLELIGEFSRIVSLSLRLFGNAFAGEVLLIIIAILAGYVATVVLPIFMVFELFIGFIQAYVFFVLTLIFTALALSHDDHSSEHSPADASKKAITAPGVHTI